MASCEKVCECPKGNCEYHSWNMYSFKRNSLQINPECRDQFKGLKAYGAVVNANDIYKSKNGDCLYFQGSVYRYGSTYVPLHEIKKVNKKYYHELFWYTRKDKLKNVQYVLDPIKLDPKLIVAVYVEEHDTFYYNYLDNKKCIRPFKKNMRRLFGYDIPIMINTKKSLKDLKMELECYETAEYMIQLIRGLDNAN